VKGIVFGTALIFALAGCSYSSGTSFRLPTSPTSATASSQGGTFAAYDLATALVGTWHGTTDSGHGTLEVVFTDSSASHVEFAPAPPATLSAHVTWTRASDAQSYDGSVSGTIGDIQIAVQHLDTCTIHASGALDEAGTTLTGSYALSGTGCVGAGVYALVKDAE
jgi:hypothetical protein